MFERVFGDGDPAGTDDDLFRLLSTADPRELPRLYACCGTEDELIGDNRGFAAASAASGIPLTTEFGPGAHDWAYWDARIQDVLAWLPLRADAD